MMVGVLMDADLLIVSRGETGEVDRLGRPVVGDTAHTPSTGRLEQTGSAEGSEYVEGSWVCYLPPTAVVDANDHVRDLTTGHLFSVDGRPSLNRIPGFPALDHVLARLSEVSSA